jgi:hypothetical protein
MNFYNIPVSPFEIRWHRKLANRTINMILTCCYGIFITKLEEDIN